MNLFLLALFLFLNRLKAHDFRCNELLGHDNHNLLTFEYIHPQTRMRGVACVSLINNRDSMLMYIEEQAIPVPGKSKKQRPPINAQRKQAIGRAQLLPNSNSNPPIYRGVIHVLNNVGDKYEDFYDLDGDTFTLSIVPGTGLGTFSIKSRLSSDDIVYIWQPRDTVPNWRMILHVPESCGSSLTTYTITDPIPRPALVKKGIVCVLSDQAVSLKFFSIGWKKAGVSGKIRKFIYFGSLKSPSTNFLNIYTGRVHALEFPCGSIPEKDLKIDRLAFKETLVMTAVRSLTSSRFMLYGDLQEIWFDPKMSINPSDIPNFPVIPISFESNYRTDLGNVYGLPSIKQ